MVRIVSDGTYGAQYKSVGATPDCATLDKNSMPDPTTKYITMLTARSVNDWRKAAVDCAVIVAWPHVLSVSPFVPFDLSVRPLESESELKSTLEL